MRSFIRQARAGACPLLTVLLLSACGADADAGPEQVAEPAPFGGGAQTDESEVVLLEPYAGEDAGMSSEDIESVSLASTVVFPICLREVAWTNTNFYNSEAWFLGGDRFGHRGRMTFEGRNFSYTGGLKHSAPRHSVYYFDLHTESLPCTRSGQVQSVVIGHSGDSGRAPAETFDLNNGTMTIWRCEARAWGGYRTRAETRYWRGSLTYGGAMEC